MYNLFLDIHFRNIAILRNLFHYLNFILLCNVPLRCFLKSKFSLMTCSNVFQIENLIHLQPTSAQLSRSRPALIPTLPAIPRLKYTLSWIIDHENSHDATWLRNNILHIFLSLAFFFPFKFFFLVPVCAAVIVAHWLRSYSPTTWNKKDKIQTKIIQIKRR